MVAPVSLLPLLCHRFASRFTGLQVRSTSLLPYIEADLVCGYSIHFSLHYIYYVDGHSRSSM